MVQITPFESAEDAWFWFMQAHQARRDGADVRANNGHIIRPCDPDDILKILSRLHRHRRLDMNHFRVLRHYGERMLAPEKHRPTEYASYCLWCEAMEILGEVFITKNIIRQSMEAEVIWFESRVNQNREVCTW